jgi:alcohol dehydrogenase class IV
MDSFRFTLPRDIYVGHGAIEKLKLLKGHKKAYVTTGGHSMRRGGFLQKVQDTLESIGMEVKIHDGIQSDPSVETVYEGAAEMREFKPDVIVSIGGGSPIDATKAMWIFYEHPELKLEDVLEPFSVPPLRQKAIFVAIPSTSGTATEVTAFSVITDYSTGIKYPLADFNLTPDIAILDLDIPRTMPFKLAAHTGMDALTHATEAYVSKFHNGFTDPLAKQAVSDIFGHLVPSCFGNADCRDQMHIAQCLAGMAFSNALLGITHSLAHKIGAVFHIPHGCANAILMPYVIQFNKKACMARYADLARVAGLPGRTDEQLVISYERAISDLNDQLHIAHSLKEHGVPEDLYLEHKDAIAHNAVLDACTPENPREVNDELMGKILECAYYGNPVTF